MKNLYHLTITDAGMQRAKAWEINHSFVICAASRTAARAAASLYAIDEPKDIWLEGRWSRCSLLGVARDTVPFGVVVRDFVTG